MERLHNTAFDDPDSDFWLDTDPDSMNMDPKHWPQRHNNEVSLSL